MDEAYGDLLEVLEMQIGVALENFEELERGYVTKSFIIRSKVTDVYLSVSPSPTMIEATSTIIYSAPYIPTKGSLFLRSSRPR